jgi:hypothetical protein
MRKFLMAVGLLCLLFPKYAVADSALPFEIQSALITKILMYDNNVDKNVKNGVLTIGILYRDDEKSRAALRSVTAEFSKLKAKGVKIKNNSLEFASVSAGGSLADDLKSKSINVLYIIDGKNIDIEDVTSTTQALKLLSIVGDDAERCVAKGVSVGLKNENDKPSILVNIQSAMKEGRDFSAQFLSLVKIVK